MKLPKDKIRNANRSRKAIWLPLAVGAAGFMLDGAAVHAQDSETSSVPSANSGGVEEVHVHAKRQTAAEASQVELNKIPGGATVVASSTVAKRRVQTNADLLKLQPGVIAAATGGGGFDSIKVSIRGSGVNNGVGYFRNGIKYEFDDLPVTTPSGTPYELFDPQGLAYTDILRGDNAFTTGDLALGGTIDYVTNTGLTAPYSEIRTELGSFGYVKGSVANGGVIGPWDYYINYIGERQDGWQTHTRASATHVIANVGRTFGDLAETRVYFRFGQEIFEGPGALYRHQIESDQPNQANVADIETNYVRKQPGSELVGDVTKFYINDAREADLGIAYQNFPIQIGPTVPTAPILADWTYGNAAAQAKYTDSTPLLGHGNELTAAAYWSDDVWGTADEIALAPNGVYPYGKSLNYLGQTYAIGPTAFYKIPGLQPGTLYKNEFDGSTDETALISDNFEAVNNVWLTVGGAVVSTPRNFSTLGHTYIPGTTTLTYQTPSFSKTETDLIPRLGLRWDVSSDLQLFASYGGNIEPREDWAGGYGPYSGTTAYTYPNYGILNLKNQRADTVEAGLRGRYAIFQGSADYFHANVEDELLTIYDPVLNENTTVNAPPAEHQGVEAELDTLLWQDGSGDYWATTPTAAQVHLVQTYDWGDFHFTQGQFGHNVEPGLPEHYYQGELAYDDPSGFYANLDARVSSSVWVDYLNTFKAAPYHVFGLSVGWQQPRADKKGWLVSFSVDNLANAKYAVAVAPTYSANDVDVANEYPGEGLGFFGALDYKF